MKALRIGDRLYPSGSLAEGVMVDATSSWLVILALANPSPADVSAVTRGAIDIAIDRDGPALIWYVRVQDSLDWSAAAWAWWQRTAPEVPPDQPGVGGIVGVVLVDAATTVIRARRTVGLTPRVASALRTIEGEAQAEGRDETALTTVRLWTKRADANAVEARAKTAAVVTGVPEKRG